MAEGEAWLEPLHQSKHVAFGIAGRVPPPASGMADDQDFAFASPVLQAESRALLPIQLPRRRGSLQHHGTMHLVAQFLDFRVVSGHVRSSRFKRRSWAQWPWARLRPCPARRPRDGRAARARGTRGSLRRTLDGAAGASGSHPPLLRFSREGSAATARTRNWAHVEGVDAGRPPNGPAAMTLVGASRNSRGAFRSPRQSAINSKSKSERSNRFRSFVGRDGVLAS